MNISMKILKLKKIWGLQTQVLFFLIMAGQFATAGGLDTHYLFPVASGMAHPSFLGAGNPSGFMYNNGVGLVLLGASSAGATANSSQPIDYAGGLTLGNGKAGGGLLLSGTANSGSSGQSSSTPSTLGWGIGAGLFDSVAFGISGTSGVNAVGTILNYSSQNRFGLVVFNPSAAGGPSHYGGGYSYAGDVAMLGLDLLYYPAGRIGTGVVGLGVNTNLFQMVVNYAQSFNLESNNNSGQSSSTSSSVGVGLGFELIHDFYLLVSYQGLSNSSSGGGSTTTSGSTNYGLGIVYIF